MYVARTLNRKIRHWSARTNPLKGPLMKFTSSFRVVIAVFLITVVALAQGPSIPPPPATPKRPVTDEYQGVKITDDYRWLENWDDPEVKQWSAAQNARSREYLDHLPARPAIRQMLKQALSASSAAYYDLQFRGGTLFAMKYQPPQQQPMLVALPSADDPGWRQGHIRSQRVERQRLHRGGFLRAVAGRQIRRSRAFRERI